MLLREILWPRARFGGQVLHESVNALYKFITMNFIVHFSIVINVACIRPGTVLDSDVCVLFGLRSILAIRYYGDIFDRCLSVGLFVTAFETI